MKKHILFGFFLLLLLTDSAFGQYAETIRTGRPGLAIGNFTAGAGLFQVQAGQEFGQVLNKGADVNLTKLTTNLILRYGLTENFEISSLLDFQWNQTDMGNFTSSKTGLSSAQLGFRYHIIDPDGWIPGVGIQYRVKLNNVLSEDFRLDNLSSKVILATGHSLAQKWSLTTNWSLDWAGNSVTPTGGYVFSLGHSLNEQWGLTAELYGGIQKDNLTYGIDLGVSYLLDYDLQLDLYGGINDIEAMQNNITDYFMSVGISWRGLTRQRPRNGVPIIEKYLNYDYGKK